MMKPQQSPSDLRNLIGNTLRIGVVLACVVAAIGGVIYLVSHGAEPMPDYTRFVADPDAAHTSLQASSAAWPSAVRRSGFSWAWCCSS